MSAAESSAAVLENARARLASGDLAGARSLCTPIVASGTLQQKAAAHLVLAACAQREGDLAAAQAQVESALRVDPDNALGLYARAELEERASDPFRAIASLEQALRRDPRFVAAHHLLGILAGERGDARRAVDAFARVVALAPQDARGYNNLGNALRMLGRLGEARTAFERAIELRPDYDHAIVNVAAAWRDAGETRRAEQLLRAALARRAGKPPARAMTVMLAGLLRERGALDEALSLYEQAVAIAPGASAGEWFNVGRIFAERDETERARDAYRRSFAADRTNLRGAIASRLALPMIAADAAQIARSRERYVEGLAALHAEIDGLVAGLTQSELLDGLRWTNFFLAYQGGDDRGLQASYANLAARALEIGAPAWRSPIAARRRSGRLRVGFASAFFRDGTAGRYFRSWVTDLEGDRFEVFVYHLYPGLDAVSSEIKARADRFIEFGGGRARPSVVAPAIRDDELDVLVYPELGMDHTSFALAALRLAPRQIAGWGHPVTTGHSTIDAFMTCADMEPDSGDEHYVERLVRLPGIGTRYRRLTLPTPLGRARLGLPEDRVLLLCPQSLFKVHPDNDDLFAAVLAANPKTALVMFEGRHRRVTELFLRRITRAFDAHGVSVRERVMVLPAASHEHYLRINLACDAMLDTLHWSGGNTSLDALACGLPVVTLPGAFMRGRQSAAMLRLAGAPELIARDRDDYVQIATRFAQDGAFRAELAARIRAGGEAIFDTPAPTHALAEFLAGVA